jgi:hypothetical protein
MKSRTVAITAIAATAVIGLGACSSSSTTSNPPSPSAPTGDLNTMNANGVTYKYPKNWSERTDISTQAQQGNRAWQQAVGPDSVSLSILSQYDLNVEVTPENASQLQGEVETTLSNLAKQAGGSTTSAVTAEQTAGLPGFTTTLTVKNPSGTEVSSTVWLFFKGKTEYFLNCQYVPAQQAELLAGCNTVRTTFAITG